MRTRLNCIKVCLEAFTSGKGPNVGPAVSNEIRCRASSSLWVPVAPPLHPDSRCSSSRAPSFHMILSNAFPDNAALSIVPGAVHWLL